MKARFVSLATIALSTIALAVQPASARNYHVSGGIQYVVQATKERAKPNASEEDARRMFGKGVAQLTEGLQEDPNDLEAWDYLGVAYAELDSAEKAGWAFTQGITAACKEEKHKKLCQRMKENREHYWVLSFNDAIRKYQSALDAAGPDKAPDSAQTMVAVVAMRRALAVNPENPKTYCNLAAFLANARQTHEALATVEAGLKLAPNDSCLGQRKLQLGGVMVEQAAQSGEFDKATAGYEKMLADNPNDASAALRLGELYFQQGMKTEEEAGKTADAAAKKELEAKARAAFASSAKGFGKYVELKPDDRDGRFNYAIALMRSENYADAAKVAHAGVVAEPTSAEFHNVLGSAYRGLKLEEGANGHTLISKALKEGNKEADPAAFAQASATKSGASSHAAKRLKEMGPPEEVRTQAIGDYQVETWFWWGRKQASILSKGLKVVDVDFNAVVTAAPAKSSSGTKASSTGGKTR